MCAAHKLNQVNCIKRDKPKAEKKMTHTDFDRIKSDFGEDAHISFADFCALKESEADMLIERVTSLAARGTLRRLFAESKSTGANTE